MACGATPRRISGLWAVGEIGEIPEFAPDWNRPRRSLKCCRAEEGKGRLPLFMAKSSDKSEPYVFELTLERRRSGVKSGKFEDVKSLPPTGKGGCKGPTGSLGVRGDTLPLPYEEGRLCIIS